VTKEAQMLVWMSEIERRRLGRRQRVLAGLIRVSQGMAKGQVNIWDAEMVTEVPRL
jgi:hypothetical protein